MYYQLVCSTTNKVKSKSMIHIEKNMMGERIAKSSPTYTYLDPNLTSQLLTKHLSSASATISGGLYLYILGSFFVCIYLSPPHAYVCQQSNHRLM